MIQQFEVMGLVVQKYKNAILIFHRQGDGNMGFIGSYTHEDFVCLIDKLKEVLPNKCKKHDNTIQK